MNKLFIVFLAVCLVSVHAFVKRETPQSTDSLKNFQEQLQAFGKQIGDKVSETFNPDQLKKNIDELMASINKAIGPKAEAPKQ